MADRDAAKDKVSLDDLALLAQVRAAVQEYDPVPPNVLAAAKASLTWRTVDAELAALAHDSAVDEELVAVRGDAPPRALTFTGPGLTVELEVRGDVLLGQLEPAAAAEVRLRTPGGPGAAVSADALGMFRLQPAPRGPVSLLVRVPGRGDVVTEWLVL